MYTVYFLSQNSNFAKIGGLFAGANNSSAVSVANNTGVEINSVTVTESGTYLLIGTADWQSNANGYRQLAFADSMNPGRNIAVTTSGIDGKEAYQQCVQIVAPTGQTTYKLYARQTSGSTINVYPYLIAIRI